MSNALTDAGDRAVAAFADVGYLPNHVEALSLRNDAYWARWAVAPPTDLYEAALRVVGPFVSARRPDGAWSVLCTRRTLLMMVDRYRLSEAA